MEGVAIGDHPHGDEQLLMARLRATLFVAAEYEADPDDYGTDDPDTMAAIDLENLQGDVTPLLDANNRVFELHVEPC